MIDQLSWGSAELGFRFEWDAVSPVRITQVTRGGKEFPVWRSRWSRSSPRTRGVSRPRTDSRTGARLALRYVDHTDGVGSLDIFQAGAGVEGRSRADARRCSGRPAFHGHGPCNRPGTPRPPFRRLVVGQFTARTDRRWKARRLGAHLGHQRVARRGPMVREPLRDRRPRSRPASPATTARPVRGHQGRHLVHRARTCPPPASSRAPPARLAVAGRAQRRLALGGRRAPRRRLLRAARPDRHRPPVARVARARRVVHHRAGVDRRLRRRFDGAVAALTAHRRAPVERHADTPACRSSSTTT